jgi:poly-beta-1,6-N-acetyl-D-glucosamine synthase
MYKIDFYTTVSTIIAIFVLMTLMKNYLFLVLAPFYTIKEKNRYIKAVNKRYRREKNKFTYEPKISIIVPAWNEEVGILKTMDSIIENGYSNFELVVINDGSTDNSDNIITDYIIELKKQHPTLAKKIKYEYQENGGKGVALNNGINLSTGEIIVTVDADSALEKGSLKNLTRYYLDENIYAVVGNVQVTNTKTLVGLAQHIEYYFGFYNKRTHALLNAEYIFGGACASFRREVFEKVGLFDTQNKTEDIEMSMRLKFHGYECTYAEDVICYTEGASNVEGLIAQRVRWKKGRLDTFWKYRSMFFSKDDSHNAFLSFVLLPYSLLTELQLIFEPIAIAILIAYSLITSEFVSIFIAIAFIGLVYFVVSLWSNNKIRLDLFLHFPFTWPLFYFLDWIEFLALFKSINLYIEKKEVVWQTWNRTGIK